MDALITAFVSGKGGTGKSTTAVFVGAALAAMEKKVVLVEMSPGMRSADIMAGVSEQVVFDIEDVLSGRAAPSRAMVQSPLYGGLSIIPAPFAGGRLPPESMKLLCQRLRPHFQHILLDVAAGYGQPFQAAAGVAHRFALVETPDPVALRDGRTLVDNLDGHPAPQRLILNMVDPDRIVEDALIPDLDSAIDTVGVQLLGLVPDSAVIRKAAQGAAPLPAGSLEAKVYEAIARRIDGEEVPLVYQ